VDRIDATRPACTWDTKYGLKGTLTRGWPAGENNRTEARLKASSDREEGEPTRAMRRSLLR